MTTITIERATIDREVLEQAAALLNPDRSPSALFHQRRDCADAIRAALAAPATAPVRKPMTDEDTLALFNRIQTGMRFTDADIRPFAAGVAAAEFFHKIKGTP